MSKKKPPLGSGARFAKLEKSLEDKGAEDPKALAAWIGQRKYGAGKMAKMAAKSRAKHGMQMGPSGYGTTHGLMHKYSHSEGYDPNFHEYPGANRPTTALFAAYTGDDEV